MDYAKSWFGRGGSVDSLYMIELVPIDPRADMIIYKPVKSKITASRYGVSAQHPRGVSFFRKAFRSNDSFRASQWHMETSVAKKLMKHPVDNVVNVYAVTPTYIDYQILEFPDEPDTRDPIVRSDIKNGLVNLHRLGFVYVDLKPDNFGWDRFSAQWRIIDFDLCGKMDKSHRYWIAPPPDYSRLYADASRVCRRNIDDRAFLQSLRIATREKLLRAQEMIGPTCKDDSLIRIDKLMFFATFDVRWESVSSSSSITSSSSARRRSTPSLAKVRRQSPQRHKSTARPKTTYQPRIDSYEKFDSISY